MKNSYNPYSVPENFFDNARKKAMSAYRRRRCVARCAIAAVVTAILVVPAICHFTINDVQEVKMSENTLAELYEYDIFLQVNFR